LILPQAFCSVIFTHLFNLVRYLSWTL